MLGFAAGEARMLLLMALVWISLLTPARGGVLQDAIIGGHEAHNHSRPYMAYLSGKSKCGGILVRNDFVMTAAHCNKNITKITLGAHNIKMKEESQQDVQRFSIFLHPEYDPKTFANDIMLLKLKSKVKLNKFVKPIPLPPAKKKVKAGDVCSVAGWGRTAPRGRLADKLQEVNLKVVEVEECKKISENFEEDSMICAGDPQKREASFNGDSGGPLVCQNVLQGIVSHGLSNGQPPRIFTKISHFLPWIKKILR
ncbi:granzyme B(G,H)-like [Pleurodeles waltl]|uniref:granzyme B(G,H)-like n=1 Tax=Pleurodeles waltl TaxID=8319 RepID=UPI00370972ED